MTFGHSEKQTFSEIISDKLRTFFCSYKIIQIIFLDQKNFF